ncbi:MAG: T9SS type A sorting domain-containing protein [Bacteroidales bacterium]
MRKLLLILSALPLMLTSEAQTLDRSTLATAGDYFVKPGMQLSWTLGQPSLVETFVKPSVVLMQGFQQADIMTNVPPVIQGPFTVTVYPNPSSDRFTIQLSAQTEGEVGYSLFDISGKLVAFVENGITAQGQWSIQQPVDALAPGVYYCQVRFEGTDGSYRIHHSKLSVLSH